MSFSIYLISSAEISKLDALKFFKEISSVDINEHNTSAVVYKDDAQVWIRFLEGEPLNESDNEEVLVWTEKLNATPKSFFELTLGQRDGSRGLAADIAKSCSSKWEIILDTMRGSIYCANELDEFAGGTN